MAKPTVRTRHERRANRDAGQAEPANVVREVGAMPQGFAELIWHQIEPDPENPRKDFDSDEAQAALNELAASIERDGLLENLVVRQAEPPHGYVAIKRGDQVLPFHRLIAGERRWRAIGRLIERGAWPADRPIMCKVVELEDADHRRIALIENLQRRDLKPLEEARAIQALAELTGASAAQLGRDLGFTERWAQQRLSLLKLPDDMQGRMAAGDLTIEDAREAAAILPKLPEIKQVELRKGKMTVAAAKLWLANRPTPVELTPDEELVFLEVCHLIARKGKQHWTEAPCDYRWKDGVTASLVEEKRLLRFGREWETGKTTVRLAHAGAQTIEALIATDYVLDKGKILALARRAQTRALGNPLAGDDMAAVSRQVDELEKSKRYLTKWLNAPFDVDPEFKAEAEKRAAQIAKQAQRDRELQEQREARAARLKAAAPLAMRFAQDIDAVPMGALARVLEDLESKLPWRWLAQNGRGMLVDAEGREVHLDRWASPEGLLPLVMALVNAAGGHPAVFDGGDQVDLEEAIDSVLSEDRVAEIEEGAAKVGMFGAAVEALGEAGLTAVGEGQREEAE